MKILSKSAEETILLGNKLGSLLNKGSILLLKGDLAGGKTTFTKGIGQALNSKDVINSPTFTILKIHKGDLTLYHIDAYRLAENPYDLGFEEYYDEGIMVIEWPEYYYDLPKEYIALAFKYVDDNTREIEIDAKGEKNIAIIKEFEKLC